VTLTTTPSIEALRSYKAAPMFRPTLQQLSGVVNGLKYLKPLNEISARTGLAEDEVLRVVADLGSWLAKSNGGAKYTTRNAIDEVAPQFFQYIAPTPPRDRRKQAAPSSKPKKPGRRKKAEVIVIPDGFESTAPHGRDVANSLAAIVKHAPDEATLTRFQSRTYSVTTQVLTYPIVTIVWLFGRLGRLGAVDPVKEAELAASLEETKKALRAAKTAWVTAQREGRTDPQAHAAKIRLQATYDSLSNELENFRLKNLSSLIDPTNEERGASQRVLAEILVEAYDLLEVARLDAIAGVDTLISGTTDLDALSDACAKAAVLDEGTLRQVARRIDAARLRPEARPILARELRYFAKNVEARPNYFRPATIGSLSEAQVRKIAIRAGLSVDDDTETRRLEHKVRTQLRGIGFESDADRLVPLGVRATESGQADEFWAILNSRIAGDPHWVSALEQLFEGEKPETEVLVSN